MSRPLIVWRLRDGKPGHEKQTLGLLRALQQRLAVDSRDLPIHDGPAQRLSWWWRQRRAARDKPDLVIGAGHRTHRYLLLAKWLLGAKTAVLMKPSLPRRWFDAVIAPEHDRLPPAPNLLATRGALNAVTPGKKQPGSGAVLLGGPSEHYRWDSDAVAAQVRQLLAAEPERHWVVGDSRRSPKDLLARIAKAYPDCECQPWSESPAGWLEQTLATSEVVWVSPDSVSMVYEALTARAQVGVLELDPAKADSRVVRGLASLIEQHLLTAFNQWRESGQLHPPAHLDEAGRAAEWLIERCFPRRQKD